MPANAPLTAAGPRDPQRQRPRPIPRNVRAALDLMVYGRPDDKTAAPLDFIAAAKEVAIRPDNMRRWLDRSQVRAYLLAARRTFRAAICAGNEGALQNIRDTAANAMARVAAVRTLEALDEEASARPPNGPTPGVTIRIVSVTAPPPIDPVRPAVIERAIAPPMFGGGPSPDD